MRKKIGWTILAVEASHVFCCVLPTLVSLLSLLTSLGLVSSVPKGLTFMHDLMHNWEIPIIIGSGLLLLLGWWLHRFSKTIDCHDNGCEHEPCGPKKDRTSLILKIATVIFAFNVLVFVIFHRGLEHFVDLESYRTEAHGSAHDHDGHGH